VEHRVLDAVSTPPPLGEDVVPVVITVTCGLLSKTVLLSDDDARESAAVRAFEEPALALARRLSRGAVTHWPD
jgi:hypothetical protein